MQKFCKEISLAFLRPDLTKEWDYNKNHPILPENMFAKSHKRVWWLCKKNHSYEAIILNRTRGDSCPYCSGHRVCKDNCLASKNPQLALEWHPTKNNNLSPDCVTCGSKMVVWWLCKNGHSWSASVKTRSKGYGCCPFCNNKTVCADNCLSITNPKLATEWDYSKNGMLTPNDVLLYNIKKMWWNCSKGHSYSASIYNRNRGLGCPYCAGRKVCNDNCLATLYPALASEWDYEQNEKGPLEYTLHSGKKVYWRCSKGHKWRATIADRSGGTGCPCCDKIEIKDGAICDSLAEAYHYLKIKESGVRFKLHVAIGLGNRSCDFHILDSNEYIEVTGFDNSWLGWRTYLKKISVKKKHVETILNAKFTFIQMDITPQQIRYVRENLKQTYLVNPEDARIMAENSATISAQ